MRTLTPARLLFAPGQVSLVHELVLPDIPSPPTAYAPAAAMLCFRLRLGPRLAWTAIGGSSDFVHCTQSHQSYPAASSSCRESPWTHRSTDYPFTSNCSPPHHRGDAVIFGYWRLAPPERDFHPLAHTHSQAHARGLPGRSSNDLSRRSEESRTRF